MRGRRVIGSSPVAASPVAMSASLASARMKSRDLYGSAWMRASFWSRDFIGIARSVHVVCASDAFNRCVQVC